MSVTKPKITISLSEKAMTQVKLMSVVENTSISAYIEKLINGKFDNERVLLATKKASDVN